MDKNFSLGAGTNNPRSSNIVKVRNDCENEKLGSSKQEIKNNEERVSVFKEEVIASHVMKDLTNKYGTRGKSAKNIFLQAYEDELSGGGKGKKFLKTCDEEQEQNYESGNGVKTPTRIELVTKAHKMSHALGQIMERPAAMVTQSVFLRRLDEQIKQEMTRLSCGAPVYEMYWLFEEGGATGSKGGSTLSVRDAIDEPEEKLLSRLKVYKRAFSAIILHFEALRPILRDIKRIYDFVLNFKEQQLKDAKTVTRNIHHAEKALEDQMEKIRFEGYLRVAELEKQCMLLMTHVEKQDAAINTMTSILVKLETSLSEEHDIRRESEDSRKLLIIEINGLRIKMGMGPRLASGIVQVEEQEETQGDTDVITKEDPLVLRAALEICRKNLSDAQHRLTVLEADYSDVIPRHEFVSLKEAMNDVQESQKKTNATYDILASQVQGLKDKIEKLIAERDILHELVGDLRKKATPRPSWNKIAEHVNGGLPYWESVYVGKSSNEIVDRLVEELTGKKINNIPEYKQGYGLGLTVPRHLRFDGKVRVRQLTRRDMAVIIQDIWQTRIDQLDLVKKQNEIQNDDESGSYSYGGGTSSQANGPIETIVIQKFSDFFVDYFEERYHLPNLRMEWIYNLVDGCKRLGIDERLKQFLGILEGNIDEAVYHLFRDEVNQLNNALKNKAMEIPQTGGGGGGSMVPLSDFNKILEEILPNKIDDEFQRLSRAAAKQSKAYAEWSPVKFVPFFQCSDEGLIGEFIDEMSKQMDEDRMRYVYEILNELLAELGVSLASAEREDDPAGDTDVSMTQIYIALTTVDPTLPDDKIGAGLSWIYMGESTLPGTPKKGILLVEYIKTHLRRSGYDSDEEDENDDEDFEKALRDIQNRDSPEDEDITPKKRRNRVKKLKLTSLRLIVKRLKGGPFLRHGLRYAKAEEIPPVVIIVEGGETSGEHDHTISGSIDEQVTVAG